MSLFQVLDPFSQRWEAIVLPLSLFMAFCGRFAEDVPLLRTISLTPIEPGFVATWYPVPIFRALSLRGFSLSYLDIPLSIANWNHLLHLNRAFTNNTKGHRKPQSLHKPYMIT